MSRVFSGWKRKTGGVTLILACIVMLCWMRTYFFLDILSFRVSQRIQTLYSNNERLYWMGVSRLEETDGTWQYQYLRIGNGTKVSISTSQSKTPTTDSFQTWIIPYWMIVMPLCAISGLLLPTKTRSIRPAFLEGSQRQLHSP